jgi:hypothetical protein
LPTAKERFVVRFETHIKKEEEKKEKRILKHVL